MRAIDCSVPVPSRLKTLRILITNNTLASRAGTELYTRDVALSLFRRGHTPICYSSVLGDVAGELRAAGITVVDHLDDIAAPPDVIHGQHHLDTIPALLQFADVPAVYFCHGVVPWEEMPPRFPRILRYVAVDYIGRDLLLSLEIPADRVRVLFNFVDLERFRPREPLPVRPRRALVFSNRASEETYLPAVRQACEQFRITVDVMGVAADAVCAMPEQVVGNYDIVFAKGRAALESMAVGTAVVLCDAAGTGPMVTTGKFEELRQLNFGWRTFHEPVNVETLQAEIALYDAEDAARVSSQVRACAGMDSVIDQIILIYTDVIAEHSHRSRADFIEESRAVAAYLQWLGKSTKEERTRSWRLKISVEETRKELEKITHSRGWRLLSRYGRIKHRVLLPAYKSISKVFKSDPANYL